MSIQDITQSMSSMYGSRHRRKDKFRPILCFMFSIFVLYTLCIFWWPHVATGPPKTHRENTVAHHTSKANALRSVSDRPKKLLDELVPKQLVIGIVAACVQDRFYRFLEINKAMKTWSVTWKSGLRFVSLHYKCKDPAAVIDYPSDIHGFKLVLETARHKFSRARNINQMMNMEMSKNTVFMVVDVDIQISEHVLWKIKKYVRPGTIYFPKIWSNYNPKSSDLVRKIAKFDVDNFSPYKGTWRKYGYGMFAIHRQDIATHQLNETFEGWGGEDKEYFNRVRTDTNMTIIRWQEPHLVHHWHVKNCQKLTDNIVAFQNCLSSKSNYDSSKLGFLLMSSNHVRASVQRKTKLDSAFVCVTGQLKRLELESKIRRLLLPLLNTFKHVRVGLALSSGKTRYTNMQSNTFSDSSSFISIGEAKAKLKRIGVKAVHFEEPEFAHVELNSAIVNQYDKVGRGIQYRQSRARNHVRQYQTISTCNNILGRIDTVPDISIRIRDDAYISHFDVEESLRKLHFEHTSMFIVTEDCAAWHGINDKFALVNGKESESLFVAPIKHYPAESVPQWVINPETFFMHSYMMEGLQTITSDSIEIVTSTPVWNDNCWKMVPRGVADCEKKIVSASDTKVNCIRSEEETVDTILQNTVITIKTFERPKCLFALLRSIRLLPQPIDVIIGDDSAQSSENESREILGDWLVSYMDLPYNSGAGYGRNRIVEKALDLGYGYFVMSDDDYIVQNPSMVRELAKTMSNMPTLDVIAPLRCENYNDCHMGHVAKLVTEKDELFMMVYPKRGGKSIQTDVVQQFFLARSRIGPVWDDKLKCNDHYDAMLTLKKHNRQLFTDYGLRIFHNKASCQDTQDLEYANQRRSRWLHHMPYVLKKWNLRKYYDEFGRVWEVDSESQRIKTQCGIECTKKPVPTVKMDGIMWTYGKCQYFTKSMRKHNQKDCPIRETS